MMLAKLGLRAGEVAFLTLDDIDWRSGETRIRVASDFTKGLGVEAPSASCCSRVVNGNMG
jgi:integrase/recombinase XerD